MLKCIKSIHNKDSFLVREATKWKRHSQVGTVLTMGGRRSPKTGSYSNLNPIFFSNFKKGAVKIRNFLEGRRVGTIPT